MATSPLIHSVSTFACNIARTFDSSGNILSVRGKYTQCRSHQLELTWEVLQRLSANARTLTLIDWSVSSPSERRILVVGFWIAILALLSSCSYCHLDSFRVYVFVAHLNRVALFSMSSLDGQCFTSLRWLLCILGLVVSPVLWQVTILFSSACHLQMGSLSPS